MPRSLDLQPRLGDTSIQVQVVKRACGARDVCMYICSE